MNKFWTGLIDLLLKDLIGFVMDPKVNRSVGPSSIPEADPTDRPSSPMATPVVSTSDDTKKT